MWIKITKQHLRCCPECLQLCLKVAEPFYDGEYLDDADEVGVCHDCVEGFVAAVPDQWFRELLAETEDRQQGLKQDEP